MHRESPIRFPMVYLHLTLARSKGQSQGHAHFDCEYLVNGDRQGEYLLLPTRMKSPIGFRMVYLHFTLARCVKVNLFRNSIAKKNLSHVEFCRMSASALPFLVV